MTAAISAGNSMTVGGEGDCAPVSETYGEMPFPIDALPEPIGDFSASCAAALSAPPELVAIPALVAAAAAIGNSRAIKLKPGWTESASLFAAVISPSGAMKTPALQMATKPIQNLESPPRRTWTSDVTVERLAGLLEENPRGLLLVRDELSAWVKSMNQYKAGGCGSDRQFYLSVWGGVPVKVDRKASGDEPKTISVMRPCLSVIGGIPPDVVHELGSKTGDEDGFLPRLLFSWPEHVPVRWTDQVVPDQLNEAYADRIKSLYLTPLIDHPLDLNISPEGMASFTKWHDLHCAQMETPELPSFLRAAYAKFKGYCARLALVHAVTKDPSTTVIGMESIISAIRLIHYFKAQAAKVMPLLAYSQQGDMERCKAAIIRKVSVCQSISKRDLQRSSSFDANIFNPALESLSVPAILVGTTGIVTLYEPTNRQAESPCLSKVPLINSKEDGPDTEHGSESHGQKILS